MINTLVESLFVYRLSVINEFHPPLLKVAQDKIWKFIWKGKRSKMNFATLRLSKDKGGLRLIDLHAKQTALLVQWIFTIQKQSEEFLQASMMDALRTPLENNLWYANLKEKDVPLVFPEDNFWTTVFKAWCIINFVISENYVDVVNQFLWFNSNIRRKDAPFVLKYFINANILQIKDILAESTGEFLTHNELQTKYALVINWLDYEFLKSCIPVQWKELFKNVTQWDIDRESAYKHKYDMLNKAPKVSKVIYRSVNNNSCVLFDAYNRWGKTLSTELTFCDFEHMFENISKITISAKLRDFQFRLLHKKIPSNYELHKWKLKTTDKCDFCDSRNSILHTLLECNHVRTMWEKIRNFLNQYCTNDNEFNFGVADIIFNTVHAKPSHICNMLILISKQLICRYKCKKQKVNYSNFIAEVRMQERIEYFLAKQTNKVNFHNVKWNKLRIDVQFNRETHHVDYFVKTL